MTGSESARNGTEKEGLASGPMTDIGTCIQALINFKYRVSVYARFVHQPLCVPVAFPHGRSVSLFFQRNLTFGLISYAIS